MSTLCFRKKNIVLQFKWLICSQCLCSAAKMDKQHHNAQSFFLLGPNGVCVVSRQPQLEQQRLGSEQQPHSTHATQQITNSFPEQLQHCVQLILMYKTMHAAIQNNSLALFRVQIPSYLLYTEERPWISGYGFPRTTQQPSLEWTTTVGHFVFLEDSDLW